MTPQQKKRLSYAKDRRNTFGENSKASRKGIPLSKARGIRSERHAQDHTLAQALRTVDPDQLDALENKVRSTGPRDWRKSADQPLGEVLARRKSRRSENEA
ncbi:hypothetical protein [Polaromonas sp. YR568]|uniref:hypothetical protein n=1 Tax=Polaromonas sp. YR568 TaxID=1855301 RepID=UPI001113EDE2|nr:hypothetical protein [Polaromonas sp. YR568]